MKIYPAIDIKGGNASGCCGATPTAKRNMAIRWSGHCTGNP